MYGNRWGVEGPPEWAYGHVSDPERFAPLQDAARALLADLEDRYRVTREERMDPDPGLLRESDLARPFLRLTPIDTAAAPLTFAFTAPPAVVVRLGHWVVEPFPVCTCDACDATVEREAERLAELVDAVVSGGFREDVHLPLLGSAWLEHELRRHGSFSGGKRRLKREEGRRMLAGRSRSYQWAAWPVRMDRRSGPPSVPSGFE